MDLYAYLIDRDGKIDRDQPGAACVRLAADAGTTVKYLYMLALGHKRPSLTLAQRIETATNGAVSVAEWPRKVA